MYIDCRPSPQNSKSYRAFPQGPYLRHQLYQKPTMRRRFVPVPAPQVQGDSNLIDWTISRIEDLAKWLSTPPGSDVLRIALEQGVKLYLHHEREQRFRRRLARISSR